MKLLTKEEEQAHYNATLKGGIVGGLAGLAISGGLVVFAHRRFHFFNQLTPQLKAFLITSGGTFTGIISADHSSRAYETQRNPLDRQYAEREKQRQADELSALSWTERAMDFGRKERYKIVGGSWLASMIAAFAIVNRNKYLTGPQKLVQARVYAQFLTLGVLVATAAFEISDSKNEEGKFWETVRVIDPNDPEHKRVIEKKEHKEEWQGQELWRDMVDAEEQRMKERERGEKRLQHEREKKKGKSSNEGKGKDESKKDAKKSGGKDDEEEEEEKEEQGDNNEDEKEEDKKSDKKGDKKDDKKGDKGGKKEKKK